MKLTMSSQEFPTVEQNQPADADRPDPDFDAAIDGFRHATRMGTDRPDEFWSRQHTAIMERIGPQQPVWQTGLSWALATALVVFGFGLFLFRAPAQPVTDYAGGYDQELLLDVARALDQEVPSALEPALLLSDEIEQNRLKKPTR
jgi:hypothetical protein